MKTNNIASYSDVLVTCMRQNPRWILLSEVRSAEAVMAVRNSISSGHNILSTIHSDKASSIPSRLYSLLETNQDIDQFLKSIHRYVQLGVHIKGYYSKEYQRFHREVSEVVEFYVDEENNAQTNVIYKKSPNGKITIKNPTKYLLGYLESQGIILEPDILVKEQFKEMTNDDYQIDVSNDVSYPTINKPVETPNIKPINQTHINIQDVYNRQNMASRNQQIINNQMPATNMPNNNLNYNNVMTPNNMVTNNQTINNNMNSAYQQANNNLNLYNPYSQMNNNQNNQFQ